MLIILLRDIVTIISCLLATVTSSFTTAVGPARKVFIRYIPLTPFLPAILVFSERSSWDLQRATRFGFHEMNIRWSSFINHLYNIRKSLRFPSYTISGEGLFQWGLLSVPFVKHNFNAKNRLGARIV